MQAHEMITEDTAVGEPELAMCFSPHKHPHLLLPANSRDPDICQATHMAASSLPGNQEKVCKCCSTDTRSQNRRGLAARPSCCPKSPSLQIYAQVFGILLKIWDFF